MARSGKSVQITETTSGTVRSTDGISVSEDEWPRRFVQA
jgi:hypothetical protein